jgi:hypothetical protein
MGGKGPTTDRDRAVPQNSTKKAAKTHHIPSNDPIRVDCWRHGATASNYSTLFNENIFFVAPHFFVQTIPM